MGIKKYINDYRKEYVVKPNGKPGMTAVYVGKYYRFTASEAVLNRAKRLFACLSVIATILCIVPFCYQSVGAHTFYVAIPHVVALLPLAHLIMGVYNLYTFKIPLIREFKDKTEVRISSSSLFALCCMGITAVAQCVNCFINGINAAEIIYFLLTLLSAACCGYIFFNRKLLATEECAKDGN